MDRVYKPQEGLRILAGNILSHMEADMVSHMAEGMKAGKEEDIAVHMAADMTAHMAEGMAARKVEDMLACIAVVGIEEGMVAQIADCKTEGIAFRKALEIQDCIAEGILVCMVRKSEDKARSN